MDNSILGIPNNIVERVCLPNLSLKNLYESCRETDKKEGLAGTNSSLVLLDLASLGAIKTALQLFGTNQRVNFQLRQVSYYANQ